MFIVTRAAAVLTLSGVKCCRVATVDMELLAEFISSPSPNYKHGTPDGVQHSKSPNSSNTNSVAGGVHRVMRAV